MCFDQNVYLAKFILEIKKKIALHLILYIHIGEAELMYC